MSMTWVWHEYDTPLPIDGHNTPLLIDSHSTPLLIDSHNTQLSIDCHNTPLPIDSHNTPLLIDGHNTPLLIDIHNTPLLIDGHNTPLLIDGHNTPLLLDGHDTPLSIDNHNTPLLIDGHNTPLLIDGHNTPLWIDGHDTPLLIDGHNTPLLINGHDTPLSIDGHNTSLPIDSHNTPLWIDGYKTPLLIEGRRWHFPRSRSTIVDNQQWSRSPSFQKCEFFSLPPFVSRSSTHFSQLISQIVQKSPKSGFILQAPPKSHPFVLEGLVRAKTFFTLLLGVAYSVSKSESSSSPEVRNYDYPCEVFLFYHWRRWNYHVLPPGFERNVTKALACPSIFCRSLSGTAGPWRRRRQLAGKTWKYSTILPIPSSPCCPSLHFSLAPHKHAVL